MNEGSTGETASEQGFWLLSNCCVYSVVLQALPPSSALWQGPGAPKAQTSATAPPTG